MNMKFHKKLVLISLVFILLIGSVSAIEVQQASSWSDFWDNILGFMGTASVYHSHNDDKCEDRYDSKRKSSTYKCVAWIKNPSSRFENCMQNAGSYNVGKYDCYTWYVKDSCRTLTGNNKEIYECFKNFGGVTHELFPMKSCKSTGDSCDGSTDCCDGLDCYFSQKTLTATCQKEGYEEKVVLKHGDSCDPDNDLCDTTLKCKNCLVSETLQHYANECRYLIGDCEGYVEPEPKKPSDNQDLDICVADCGIKYNSPGLTGFIWDKYRGNNAQLDICVDNCYSVSGNWWDTSQRYFPSKFWFYFIVSIIAIIFLIPFIRPVVNLIVGRIGIKL